MIADPRQPLTDGPPATRTEEFARAADETSTGLVREFVDFLRFNRKWWLTPIIVILLMVGVVVILGTTAAGPFIYTLF